MITIEPIPDPVFVLDMHHFNQINMEDFHTMDMCVFNLETDPDKTFYDNDQDKEFYEKHSPGLWGKCKCENKEVKADTINLLTPPTSPQHDPFSDIANTNDVLSDAINGVDDETLTNAYIAAELFADLKFDPDTLNSNLVQDCMWSGPGLAAAGFGVNAQISKKRTVDENCNTIVKKKKTSDIKTSDCVDPADVFPRGLCSRNTSPTPSTSSPDCEDNDWISGLETPSASESDEEEIDVVGVADKSARSSSHRHSTPALNSSVKSRPMIKVVNSTGLSSIPSTNLPATTSMSAQVAALHNYSSTTPSSKTHSCLKATLSAPQTPSSNGFSSLTSSLKRSRPFSSPNSPPSCKKQRLLNGHRLIANEKDLQLVARKLSSGRKPKVSSYTDSHSYSRSSSDNEDLSESGKRAYHNVLERKRRDDLRLSFHMLRQVVPEIRDNERAPKMVILNTSTEHVMELTRESLALNAELQKQKHYNEQLKKKLALLRRDQF